MPTKKEQQSAVIATLPNSVEAEQNVLFCIMRNQAMQLEIMSKLSADDFYQPNHAVIFDAMKEISRRSHKVGEDSMSNSVNFTTVVDCLRRNGKLAQVGDIDYILRLNEILPSSANYDEYISIVKRASMMRKLISICGEVTQKAYSSDSAEDVITYAEEEIFRLSQKDANSGLVAFADATARTMLKINERFVNPDNCRGIQTGFKRFDSMTNGLHGGELIVLAARPGVGKSTMAMNIVENVAKQGKTVAVYSLEMSNEQLVERLLSSMSAVSLKYIKNGQLPNGDGDIAKLRVAQDIICSSMQLYGNDYANIRPSEISSQCRRLKAQHGLDLIVVDYIQLMNSDSKDANQGRQNEVASITRALKLIAKELNVPVIALSQLKRDAEIRNIKGEKTGGGEPVLSDLRESGAIEQDADIVLFIHKETDQQTGSTKHSLIVAKHRNGELGTIPVYMLGSIVRFVDDYYLNQYNIKPEGADDKSAEPTDEDMTLADEQSEEETFTISENVDGEE
ncbi:MAG: replicative DNA helicase [Firmicutes bacterium]|nr:replicative DNA helicase [Bacillota bacterium]